MGNLRLHPTRGVNPHLTVCQRCGGESQELILIGALERVDKCDKCGVTVFGGITFSRPCPKCGSKSGTFVRTVGEFEKLPSTQPCDKCMGEITLHKAIVASGGIFFRCKKCGIEGVVRAESELSKIVREKTGVAAPAPVGVEFDDCCQHTVDDCDPRPVNEGGTKDV